MGRLDRPGHRDGHVLAGPPVDLAQRVHDSDTTHVERQRIASGAALEEQYGYSRAVRVGNHIWVAGTAPIMPGDADPPPTAYEQAQVCLGIIQRALEEAGASLADVVRTRIYVTDAAYTAEVGRAHGEAFVTARPALTGIVTGLLDPRWLVEIEADAVVGGTLEPGSLVDPGS
jgi:enamine deaminase RidA (YjgF/YER057c/UK114 family)